MGAVHFSLDSALAELFRDGLSIDAFVETGTFQGDTAMAMKDLFDQVYTVELSQDLFNLAVERFATAPNVHALQGNSADTLGQLQERLAGKNTIYWLDAHWCEADMTSGQQSQCPLLGELEAIGSLGDNSVVLIDDARFFLSPPAYPHEVSQWPRLDAIITALYALNSSHRLMVVNDVIAFYPAKAEVAVVEYARKFGIDWLRASQSLAENTALRQDNEAKEVVINTLAKSLSAAQSASQDTPELNVTATQLIAALQAFESQLKAKEDCIQQQARSISLMQKNPVRRMSKLLMRYAGVVRPRLGNLHQHGPVPLTLPAAYYQPTTLNAYPSISIVTPSYNQGHYIKQTIDSVLDQNYPKLEYFIQDGASSDDTVSVIESYGDAITGWDSSKDTGQSNAINTGFSRTSGDIMAWLNSDDILLPGALNYVARYFAENPDVDVVYGNRLIIDENGAMTGRWIVPPHDDAVLSWVDYVPQETMFWRRSIWDRAGGSIDESFRFAMDWDLILRFRSNGAKFVRLPRMLGGFRVHAAQKTSAVISEIGHQEMDRLRERELGRVPNYLEIRKAVLPYIARHVASDLKWRLVRRGTNLR